MMRGVNGNKYVYIWHECAIIARRLRLDYYVMLLQIFVIWYAVRNYGVIIIQYSVLGVAHHLCIFAVITQHANTGCPRRNVHDFGRVFLMLKYTDITQNTYIQSWTVTEIMAREVWKFDSCYTITDYQIHIKTGRNMWFL